MAQILLLFLIGAATAKPTLRVKQDGSFKLALFCDMHFGHSNDQDVASVNFEETMIQLESPDLVVIDGDGSSNYAAPDSCWHFGGSECTQWFVNNWRKFTAPLKDAGVPYAYTLGNHDRIPDICWQTFAGWYCGSSRWLLIGDCLLLLIGSFCGCLAASRCHYPLLQAATSSPGEPPAQPELAMTVGGMPVGDEELPWHRSSSVAISSKSSCRKAKAAPAVCCLLLAVLLVVATYKMLQLPIQRYAVSDHWIMQKDAANPHAISMDGPANIHGASNYVAPILGKDGKPAAYVWLLESSDNNCQGVTGWGCVYPDQVEWFKNTSRQLIARDRRVVPGVMFHHIPMEEALTAWNDDTVEVNGSRQEAICCSSRNTGLFQAMKDIGNIWGVFFGHDHNNDYVALYDGIRIGYGRKSGHGGYGGPLASRPGSRIIQLTEKPDGSVFWETWIREEAGEKIIQTKASQPRQQGGPKCCGMSDTQPSTAKWVHGSDMVAAAEACRAFDDVSACRVASGLGL